MQNWHMEKHVTNEKHLKQACHFGHLHHNVYKLKCNHFHFITHMNHVINQSMFVPHKSKLIMPRFPI